MGCLLLWFFWVTSRPIPDLPDPVSCTLRFSQPRGRPRVFGREKGNGATEATQQRRQAAGQGDGGGGERTSRSRRRRRDPPPATGPIPAPWPIVGLDQPPPSWEVVRTPVFAGGPLAAAWFPEHGNDF
ncbi:uncharacterized protein LOC124683382 [Lolium rigidum]|uniref:uncharacterized protein LOC124683382 n=1 Tax=Lolium rigidum TaxID=89674 RepID=UPI001F5C6BAE|nr:uncharacterized protein LOC124683382 [Lolium rigidum]